MSFFDEDDEPRTRVRPRRPATAAAGSRPATPDHQQVLMRRAVLGGGILLALILLVFIVRGCQNSAKENALRDYNQDVGALARASDQEVSEPLFNLLRNPTQGDDLSSQINGFRGQADAAVRAGAADLHARRDDRRAALVPDHDGDAPRRPAVDRRQRAHRALQRRRGRRRGDPGDRRRDVDVPRLRRDLRVARRADHRPRAAGRPTSATRRSSAPSSCPAASGSTRRRSPTRSASSSRAAAAAATAASRRPACTARSSTP